MKETSDSEWGSESAIIVPCLDTPPIISQLRQQYAEGDKGVPPHITLLYPFAPPPVQQLGKAVQKLLVDVAPFEYTLTAPKRFGGEVLWLSPEPIEMFIRLIKNVVAAFAGYPPYGGEYDDLIPHLTVAYTESGADLDAVEKMITPVLPIRCVAKEAWLIAKQADGNWVTVGYVLIQSK